MRTLKPGVAWPHWPGLKYGLASNLASSKIFGLKLIFSLSHFQRFFNEFLLIFYCFRDNHIEKIYNK